MPSLGRLADACTGPRASLLALLAVVSMAVMFTSAEIPLTSALQVAVALQKSPAAERLPDACASADLQNAPEPLISFDGRPEGYSETDALQILCAMRVNKEAGRRAYLDRHFPLEQF